MDTLKNSAFKFLMWIGLSLVLVAAIYVMIWKLASIMMFILIAIPFALGIMWKGKQLIKTISFNDSLAHNEKPKSRYHF